MLEQLPFYGQLQKDERELITQSAIQKNYKNGSILHAGQEECSGLFYILSGRIRAYILTEDGKEITLFRLIQDELCIFSASCMLKNITFDIWVSAETDISTVLIPAGVYSRISEHNVAVANFTNEILSSRMSDVMWVLEQILFMSFDKRLALFLKSQSQLDNSNTLRITHEQIANHMGSAREVITRMLKYFSQEGIIELKRGTVTITDMDKLQAITQ